MSIAFYEKGDVLNYPKWNVESKKKLTVQDRMIYIHDSGKIYTRYLFENLLDLLVEEMHENVENDLDNVVCIWGAEGSGKSNLAYWLAKKYDPNFDIERSYTYSFDDLLNRIHDCEDADEGSVFWMDEATNISNNRDWMHTDNKQFITMLEMFRSRKWTLILCIPDFNRLDIYLREQRIRYSLHAEVIDWENNPEKKRGYFQLTRMDYRTATGYRSENVVGYGKFDRIPEGESERYRKIKEETQNTKLNEIYDNKNKKTRMDQMSALNRKLILRLYEEDHLSAEEISEITGLTVGTVNVYMSKARKERDERWAN